MKQIFSVHWSERAIENLQQIYDYIQQDSPANATKLVNEIIARTHLLKRHPYIYPIELLVSKGRNKNYRCIIIKKNYKVIYKVEVSTIMILRVFHARQNPAKL